MLRSIESMTYNGINLDNEFNDQESAPEAYFLIEEVRGREMPIMDFTTIAANGMDGVHTSGSRQRERFLEVDIVLKGESFEDLRKRLERLAEILVVKESVAIQFADESDRTYYGYFTEATVSEERSKLIKMTLLITCPDPFKYGEEQAHEFEGDVTTAEIGGTVEVAPTFELFVTQPVTFAMVQNEIEEYQLIGVPADDDVEVVDTKTSVLYENGSTLDTWLPAPLDMIDDPNVSNVGGVMGTDGAGIRADTYGPSGSGQRGPAIYTELPTTIQDFEIESTFDIISRRESENWRIMIYFYDENMEPLGQMGLKDNSRNYKRRVPLGTAGPHSAGYGNGRVLGDQSWHNDNARDTTLFYLRARREGNEFSFYVGEWQSQRHINVWDGTYVDARGDYEGRLRYISLFVGSYQDRGTPSRIRINSVEVFELASVVEDQTPYIAYPGDSIMFNHDTGDITINGENRKDIKDFGGQYFKLNRGFNTLAVHPSDSFETRLTYREKYL